MVLVNQLDGKYNYVKNYAITNKDLEKFHTHLNKPNTEKNLGFGCFLFILHADLLQEKYSKDDSISLKISVEQIISL